jgi:Secretion system C-terminal sorting domain
MKKTFLLACSLITISSLQAQMLQTYEDVQTAVSEFRSIRDHKKTRGFQLSHQTTSTYNNVGTLLSKDSINEYLGSGCQIIGSNYFQMYAPTFAPVLMNEVTFSTTSNTLSRNTKSYDALGNILSDGIVTIKYNANQIEDSVFGYHLNNGGYILHSISANKYHTAANLVDTMVIYLLDNASNTFYLSSLNVKNFNTSNQFIHQQTFYAQDIASTLMPMNKKYTTFLPNGLQTDSMLKWDNASASWANLLYVNSKYVNAKVQCIQNRNWNVADQLWSAPDSNYFYQSYRQVFDSLVSMDAAGTVSKKTTNAFDGNDNNISTTKYKYHSTGLFISTITNRVFNVCKPLATLDVVKNSVTMYPNPIQNGEVLHIATNGSAQIMDMFGKQIATYQAVNGEVKISIQLQAGMYIVRTIDTNKQQINAQKLMVN